MASKEVKGYYQIEILLMVFVALHCVFSTLLIRAICLWKRGLCGFGIKKFTSKF